MSPGETHLAFLVVFALLAGVQLYKLGTSGSCVQCGGKGAHRDNCPRRKQ